MRSRTILFYILSFVAAVPLLLLFPLIVLPRGLTLWVTDRYLGLQLLLLRYVCGITYSIEGRQNLPDGACLIASQHESAWETLFFQCLLDYPVMFAKSEVFRYPVLGALARKIGHIPVDRGGSADGVRDGFRKGAAVVASGRKLLIFPTGTRARPGTARVHSGVAVLYQLAEAPVVPVLLDSGRCWPAGTIWKRPGHIHVRILPPLPAGMDRRIFLEQISNQLAAEKP